MSRAFGLLLSIALLLSLSVSSIGCATYSDRMRTAHVSVLSGRPEAAIQSIESELKVETPMELPETLGKGDILLLLERATLLQALGNYTIAQRDMGISDQRLEYLDIDAFDRVELAKWLYSGDAYAYRAPAFERLSLNILNMVNYLSLHDLDGAKVEARRFDLIASYFMEQTDDLIQIDLLALGYYLAAFTFEQSLEFKTSLRHYQHAVAYGFREASLSTRITDLMRVTGVFTPFYDHDLLQEAAADARALGRLSREEYTHTYRGGDTLILAQTGLVPYKKAVYLPMGAALGLASGASAAFAISTNQSVLATSLATRGILSTVHLPQLSVDNVPTNPPFLLSLDQQPTSPIHQVNLTHQVEMSWLQIEPSLVGAAITRSLTRALAGEAVNQTSQAAGADAEGSQAAGSLVQLGLAIADRPDTRSWTLLPSFFTLYRYRLSPQTHSISIQLRTGKEIRQVDGSQPYLLVNFSRFRQ